MRKLMYSFLSSLYKCNNRFTPTHPPTPRNRNIEKVNKWAWQVCPTRHRFRSEQNPIDLTERNFVSERDYYLAVVDAVRLTARPDEFSWISPTELTDAVSDAVRCLTADCKLTVVVVVVFAEICAKRYCAMISGWLCRKGKSCVISQKARWLITSIISTVAFILKGWRRAIFSLRFV